MEMVLCESLDGACNRLTEENLEPVVMKLEKAVEAKELDFGNDLYDELETRVGRLLCGLDYNQFCTPGGRSVLQEESALCRLEGINCKSRGRTLGDILDAKKQLLKAVLGIEEGSGEDLLSTIFDSKVAAVDAVLDAKKDIVQTVITGVGELTGDLADVANEVVEAKTTLAKSSVK